MNEVSKKLKCKCNKLVSKCFEENILYLKHSEDKLEKAYPILLGILETFEEKLLNITNIKELQQINLEYISMESIHKLILCMPVIENCYLEPDMCQKNYHELRATEHNLKMQVNELINMYNQHIDVVKDYLCEIKNKEDLSNIYIKMYLDRYDELFGVYFDYDKIIKRTEDSLTLYGYFGMHHRNEIQNDNHLYMYIEYYGSEMKIIDFFASSMKTRCHHGSMALSSLTDIINKLNSLFEQLNKNKEIEYEKYPKINEVYGTIRPHERYIKYDDLVTFYDKNGYLYNGSLYKEF